MRQVSSVFLKGLAAVLPVFVTVYLVIWLAGTAEDVLGGVLNLILPESWYVPGLGLLLGVVLVFLVGFLLQAYLIRRLFGLGERLLQRIPLVKTVYSALQDIMAFVSRDGSREASQVVLVRLPLGDTRARVLGFVTREAWEGLPENMGGEDEVAVYLPMSYQIGGYTLILQRKHLEPVEMGMDEAMRFAVTAGMSTQGGGGASQHKQAE
ncbi:DUF502 domain-containing protein [Aquisalimonas asiatica]|uniref:Uncharacterized membrane protein n=1 Tax=Aquisalimonas asiatica TaxID=406100 RepID=A0A1H8TDL9_9GAMM|nr:DUF502 domain-containing protein [Aquisalimonas asiatica]SEO88598.1 Uncharacterized membrane protein [Aquisalimonas asiatica]